jgi:hypothetical protein
MYEHRSTTPDGPLTRIVYRSRCLVADAPPPFLSAILGVSRRNNVATGVTGVLLFDGTNFLQAIEGRRGEVEELYERIARDLRHEEIELIECRPIAARGYSDEPMAYIDGQDGEAGTLGDLLSWASALGAVSDADRREPH